MCPPLQPWCDVIKEQGKNFAGSFLEMLVTETAKANAKLLEFLATGWFKVPTPPLGSADTGAPTGAVAELRSGTAWLVAAIAVGAILVSAGRLALERNGKEAGSLARGLVWLVVLTGGGIPIIVLLIEIGDEYSTWIVNRSTDGKFAERLDMLTKLAGLSGGGLVLMLGMGVLMLGAAITQALFALGRGAGLVLLTGLLPVAAAAGIAGRGRQMRDRYLTWLLAFILYKPAAATVIAASFFLIGDGTDLASVVTGIMAFCMSIVALPALMRLIAPAVATLSGGGVGGSEGMVSPAEQLASGAMRLNGPRGSGGGNPTGSGGGGGPTGSATPASAKSTHAAGVAGGGSAAGGGPGTGTAAGAATGGGSAAGVGGSAAAGGSSAAGAGASGAAAGGPAGAAAVVGVMAAREGMKRVRQIGEAGAIGATGAPEMGP